MIENRVAVEALIGAVLFENALIHNVGDVQPEHIPGVEGQVWAAMQALSQRGVPINTVSVQAEMGAKFGKHEAQLLIDAMNSTPLTGQIEQYAAQVLQAHERRQTQVYGEDLIKAAHNWDSDIDRVRAEVAGALLRSERRAEEYEAEALAALDLPQVEDWAAHPLKDGEVRGIPTGLRDLDSLIDGLNPSLFILAARTSVGKTTLGTQISTNVSATAPVYYVGLEQQPVVYWRRMVGQLGRIHHKHVSQGLNPTELHQWRAASDMLKARRLTLYNGSRKLASVLAGINRAYHRWGELGLVVVDNIGHIRTGQEKAYQELGTVTLSLLELSQRLGVCILGLHQINRSVEGRENKRPSMSDLRDSGYIEEGADIVGLAYRDDYYNPNSENPNIIELAIAKNRVNGRTGMKSLYFDKATGGVRDIAIAQS